MINPTQWYIMGGNNYSINTYIGGIGSVVNTPALLASKLGINVNSIKKFSVAGDDVQCAIIQKYTLKVSAFQGSLLTNSAPTFYKDLNGMCIAIGGNAFYTSHRFTLLYFPAVVTVGLGNFYHQNNSDAQIADRVMYFPLCTSFGGDSAISNNQMFDIQAITHKLIINNFNATSNGGGVNATIQYGINSKGLVNEFIPGNIYTVEDLGF